MSIINRMLQDLEQRHAGAGDAPAAVHATAAAMPRKRLLLWLVAGAALVAAAAFGDWPSLLPAHAARLPQPVSVGEPAPEPVAADAAPALTAKAPPSASPRAAIAPVPREAAAAHDKNPPALLPREAVAAHDKYPPALLPREAAATNVKNAPAPTVDYALAPAVAAPPATRLVPAPPGAAMPAPAAPVKDEPATPGRVDKTLSVQSPALRAQALYRQGIELAASGHGRTGVERLQEALRADPLLKPARIQAVTLLFEQGRNAEAEVLAREGLALAPDDAQLAYLLARGLAGGGDVAAALDLLSRSPRLSADGFGLRAGLLSQQGDFKRAQGDYEQAVRLQPGNSLWWLGLGVALEAEGQRAQARQVYARAQGIGVDSHELNVFLDQKLQQLK